MEKAGPICTPYVYASRIQFSTAMVFASLRYRNDLPFFQTGTEASKSICEIRHERSQVIPCPCCAFCDVVFYHPNNFGRQNNMRSALNRCEVNPNIKIISDARCAQIPKPKVHSFVLGTLQRKRERERETYCKIECQTTVCAHLNSSQRQSPSDWIETHVNHENLLSLDVVGNLYISSWHIRVV